MTAGVGGRRMRPSLLAAGGFMATIGHAFAFRGVMEIKRALKDADVRQLLRNRGNMSRCRFFQLCAGVTPDQDPPTPTTTERHRQAKRSREVTTEIGGNGIGGSPKGIASGSGGRIRRGGRGGTRAAKASRSTSRHQVPAFQFDLDPRRLLFVDTLDGLDSARDILSRAVLVGIDTETNPSFKVGEWHPTSLLQMGTRDARGEEYVIVLDLLAFQEELRLPDAVHDTLEVLFGSSSITKIGVGLEEDLEQLAFAYEGTPFLKSVPGMLNISDLHSRLEQNPPGTRPSLRKLTEVHLGVTLSKSCQKSPWGRRPLEQAQLKYAACDALVALRIHDAIMRKVGQVDLDKLSTTWSPRAAPKIGSINADKLEFRIANRAKRAARMRLEKGVGQMREKNKRRKSPRNA